MRTKVVRSFPMKRDSGRHIIRVVAEHSRMMFAKFLLDFVSSSREINFAPARFMSRQNRNKCEEMRNKLKVLNIDIS